MKVLVACLLAGALFGVGLAVSGMTNPAKVRAFLDVTSEHWDASLLVVLGGAVLTAAIGLRVARRCMGAPRLAGTFPEPPGGGKVTAKLVLGSAVFGVGWGLSGLCPGPAVANLSRADGELALFLVAMVAGMWGARLAFGADAGADTDGED